MTHTVTQTLAQCFAHNVGKQWEPQHPGHDPLLGHDAADWYMSQSDDYSNAVRATYAEFARYLNAQYFALATVFDVVVTTDDPYADASELFSDLEKGTLKIFATGEDDHPLWSPQQNDRFRAVHDVFGHYASHVPFCRNGEDAAYRSHARMFPQHVLPALAVETRAQNSALIYGPKPGEFAPQKATLAPSWLWSPGVEQ